MKQLLQQYAAYNLWANKKMTEDISQLSEEQINKEIVSSFPSVYKTFNAYDGSGKCLVGTFETC